MLWSSQKNTSEVGTYVSPFHSVPKGEKIFCEHARDWLGKEDRVTATVELCCICCVEQSSRHASAWGCDHRWIHSHHHTEHGPARLEHAQCTTYFSYCFTKAPGENSGRREGSAQAQEGPLNPWLAGREENWCSTSFLLFVQSGILAHIVVLLTFSVGLPNPVKSMKFPNRHAQKLFPRWFQILSSLNINYHAWTLRLAWSCTKPSM